MISDDAESAYREEKKSLEIISSLPLSERTDAIEETWDRLALLALCNARFDDSISYRNSLIKHSQDEGINSDSIELQKRIVEICSQLNDLGAEKQAQISQGAISQFQADRHFQSERPYKAIEKLEAAKQGYDAALGKDNFLTAIISGRLIDLQIRYGQPNAVDQLNACQLVLEQQLGREHIETISLLRPRATAEEMKGNWLGYVELFGEYLNRVKQSDCSHEEQLVAEATLRLAFGNSRANNLTTAANLFAESLKLYEMLYDESSLERIFWKFIRADNYTATSEWKLGELLLEKPLSDLDELESAFSGKWSAPTIQTIRRRKAETIHRHGLCAMYDRETADKFRLESARKAFLNSKKILEDLGLEKSLRYVFVLRDLCQVNYLLKREREDDSQNEAETREHIVEAQTTYRFLCGGNSGPHATILQIHQIAMERAWDNFEKSLDFANQAINGTQNGYLIAWALREAALTHSDSGNKTESVQAYANAIDTYGQQIFAHLFRSNTSSADGLANLSRDCLTHLVAAIDKINPDKPGSNKTDPFLVKTAFEYVSRIKGIVARSQSTRAQLSKEEVKSLFPDSDQHPMMIAREIFFAIIKKVKAPDRASEIDKEIQELSEKMRKANALIGNLVSVNDIRYESNANERLNRLLPMDTALVEIYFQRKNQIESKQDKYIAFIVHRDINGLNLNCIDLGNAGPIHENVANFLDLVKSEDYDNERGEFVDAGNSLRQNTWDKIQPYLGGTKSVIICGDRQLVRVPWVAIPSQANDKQFLIDNYEIISGTSSRDVIEQLSVEREYGTGSLIVSDVDFGEVSYEGTLRFQSLENSKKELNVVKAALKNTGKVDVLEKQAATVDAVIERLGEVRMAHFATHGFLIEESKELKKKHPYALASLALSNANESGQPNFLSGEQVIALNLSHLELVVLSACDSASGVDKDGEGVLGLQQAFMLAGAKSCLASRWPIGDKAASTFMTLLYENLLTENSKVKALKKAQIQMKDAGLPPREWANWKLTGGM